MAHVDINDERAVRLQKMHDLQSQGISAYPNPRVLKRKYTLLEAAAKEIDEPVQIAGRIMTKREMGKLTFCHIRDESGLLQVAFKKDELGDEQYNLFLKKIDIGDIIGVDGTRFLTQKGEQSVLVASWTLLSKALLPLPDKFHGIQDEELRYRKRYLDFLINDDQKEKVLMRAAVLKHMRAFLDKKGFVEVETPILETVASGAMARSFDTHINAFDLPVHLRICIGELWQKRLLVGGFEKTYEIGRAFRNEGVDHSHNPEFTMMESYWAFSDYKDNMKLQEKLIAHIVKKTTGSLIVENDGVALDFTPRYPRITFRKAIIEHTGIDINKLKTRESVKKAMLKHGYEVEETAERGKLLDLLYKQSARKKLVQPTFVTDYPIELKPLAKKAKDPRYTESAQLIVRGFEISNSFSELNDPVDQRERFEHQAAIAAGGEEESMAYDHDYVEALEHGMPPASGNGIGIDRLVALLTDSHTLREVMTFPLMKPEHQTTTTSQAVRDENVDHTLPMSREDAWKLIEEHNTHKAHLNHFLESEAVMRAIAKKLGRNVEYWGMLGLLHDLDWGKTKETPELHCTLTGKMLEDAGFSIFFVETVLSHAYSSECGTEEMKQKKRSTEIQYALAAGETVTGLVHASALMREDKIASLGVKSLKKKFKNKKFAAGVDRSVIQECEKIGFSLDEFLALALEAIREIAADVELA